MAAKLSILALLAAATFLSRFEHVECTPAIAQAYDDMGICIENCAQCKKIFGDWFEGELCAISCIHQKGKVIPDCEDITSITPFINKLKYLS